jgi:hypothetical protein
MVSRLSGVDILHFCLTGLYDESIPNLCSITSLGIRAYLISAMGRHLDCPKESDECEFLFGIEAHADPELLVWIAGVNHGLFVICPLLLVIHQLIGGLLCR